VRAEDRVQDWLPPDNCAGCSFRATRIQLPMPGRWKSVLADGADGREAEAIRYSPQHFLTFGVLLLTGLLGHEVLVP
jgi:hypothetical protein